jgi:hypothetical protein
LAFATQKEENQADVARENGLEPFSENHNGSKMMLI